MSSPETFTEREVAARAGIPLEEVERFVALGILEPDAGGFTRAHVQQARVVTALREAGIEPDELAPAIASGELSLALLEHAGRRHPRSELTFAELAEQMGLSLETLGRIYVAFGLTRPSEDEHVRAEDHEALRRLPTLLGIGVTEAQLLQMARVWGDSVRRLAGFQAHYVHVVIEERYRRRGMRESEAFEAAIREIGLRSGKLGEDLLGWLYRRHCETFISDHQFEHVESALEAAGVRERAPRSVGAAVFADLTGYTSLTEEAGDEVATRVSLTLAQLVNEVAARHRGEVVKMLGDGVHFHFRDPADAVRASLEIVGGVEPHGLPPAHIGVNAGPMIFEDGDYFGRTVNIAARIAAQASARQVFVGEDVTRVVEPDGFGFREVGPVSLKGIADPVTLFEAVASPS